ncbi:MAG TPA: HPF/RaiA family ribosome-associated protein [Burkholderiales bacterium]|nr:HPF/RaiA family ribosome-associated protein [Burkholderiales bacterium]
MQIPLQITVRHMPTSDALEARIRDQAAKLEEFHPHLISCRVTVEEIARHQQQGRQFQVRIDAHVPGREIAASRDHHEDVYVALRDAFAAVTRQLEEDARVKRGEVKLHEVPQHGRVARLLADEGYGFIATPDGRELYFSRENVVEPSFDNLEVGAAVQFIEEPAAEGMQAKRVSVGKHGPLP